MADAHPASSAADASFFEFFSMLEARGKGEASPQSFFSPKCPYDFLRFQLCPPPFVNNKFKASIRPLLFGRLYLNSFLTTLFLIFSFIPHLSKKV